MEEPDDQDRVRRRWWLAAAAFLIVGTVGGWFVAREVQSPDQAASRAAPPTPSWITAGVERRVLSQTVISRGDVRPEVSIVVGVPSSVEGSAVVTAVAVAVGDAVVEGSRVIEVSGRPIFVLLGAVPVYRSLRPGMSGADVVQLQAALDRLGCDTTADAGVYGSATKLCVAGLYIDAGYEPVPTSATEAVDLAAAEQATVEAQTGADSARLVLDDALKGPSSAELVAVRTALKAAQRGYDDAVASSDANVVQAEAAVIRAQAVWDRVRSSADATPVEIDAARVDFDVASAALVEARRVGVSTIAAAADGVVVAQAAVTESNRAPDVSAEYTAFAQALAAGDRANAALETLRATTGPMVPQGEVVFSPSLPARVQQALTSLGPVADGGQPDNATGSDGGGLVTLAAGDLVVSMTLRADDRGLVRVGMAVELLDEQSNIVYAATVTGIAETVTTGPDGQPGYPVVLSPDVALPDALAGVNVRVTITAASTEAATLVVPVAAVSSAADGSTNVSVLAADAAETDDPVVVAVVAGLSADGFVSVSPVTPGALVEGDRVVVGR
jgi:hypothetical protein